MIRLFQSPWFAAGLGCLLYLGTTAAILNPAKFAGFKPPAPDYSAEDDPSWKFRNPEIDQWISQMKTEKEKLDSREEHLNELQTRLNAELQEVSTATQTVNQLQDDFNKNVIRFKTEEADNIKHQAKLLSDMSPEGAAAMLNEMSDDDAVRILFTMKDDVASVILDTWSKAGKEQAKRAAILTEKLRQVLSAAPVASAAPANP
jgi:flagellar motility protein MotE (MotC chaperone)